VPHNLISTQYSPVPLPKFQMAPRLKILMSSGPSKGTQIYYPFLSKSPGKRIPSWLPNGALHGERSAYRAFLHLSWYISLSQRPWEKSGPMETDAHSRALFNTPSSISSKGALPPGPPHGLPSDRDDPFLEPSFIHNSKSLAYKPPSWFQVPLRHKGANMERDAHIHSLSLHVFQHLQ